MERTEIYKSLLAALAVFGACTLMSCNGKIITIQTSKDYVTKQIDLDSQFDAIMATDETDVVYIPCADSTAKPTAVLEAPSELINHIHVKVANGQLLIYRDDNLKIKGFNDSKITITAHGVSSFTTTGTGDIESETISAPSVKLSTTGTGDFEFGTINCEDLYLNSSGTGDSDISELTCGNTQIQTSGTGDIVIGNINCKGLAEINSSGTGDIELRAGSINKAEINTSGTGDIEMKKVSVANSSASASGIGKIKL